MAAVHEALPLRQCAAGCRPSTRARVRAGRDRPLRRAVRGPPPMRSTRRIAAAFRDAVRIATRAGVEPLLGRIDVLAAAHRYEAAAAVRDRTATLPGSAPGCSGSARSPRSRSWPRPGPTVTGGWELSWSARPARRRRRRGARSAPRADGRSAGGLRRDGASGTGR